MSVPLPASRRGGLGVAAGLVAGGLVALQSLDGWPTLRSLAMVLTPVPLVVAALRGGVLGTVTSFSVGAVVLGGAPLAEGIPAWGFVLGYGGIVAYVLLALRFMHAVNFLLLAAVAVGAGLAVIHLGVSAQRNGRALAAEYGVVAAATEAELTSNPALEDMGEERRDQLMRAAPVVRGLLPALALGQYTASVALATWACIVTVRRLRLRDVPGLQVGAWRLPEWFIFCFLAPATGLLLGIWRDVPWLTTAAANVLAIVVCIYVAQGSAILHAFLRRLGAHPLLETLVFVTILFLIPPLLLVVWVAGLFDFLVDFRGRWMPPAAAPDERPEV